MTFASTSASFAVHTSTAGRVSKSLDVSRRTKRIAQSRSCKPARQESYSLAGTLTGVGGLEAFHQMFVTWRPKFVAMANAILRNREDAEDAVQSAFLLGHRHLRSFEGRSALTTWFTRIVLNAALMIQRKHRLSRIRPLLETSISRETNWTERIPASQPDPEMVHAERETLQFINGVLAKMTPTLRQAFIMTYYDELSVPEACALLGVSAGTFKARLFRARQQLLNQAQRALVVPIRRANPSSFFPDRSAVQHLVATPLDTSSLEASYS
jgi:RNA polymerase sigma-70 factor, ECF subfamily